MPFIVNSEFQGISTCPNALGYELQILYSVIPYAVSKKMNIYGIKLFKIRK